MYEDVLQQLRQCIRTQRYSISIHADIELDADNLTDYNVERAILSGKIVEQQVEVWGELKYVVRGTAYPRCQIEVVCKIDEDGELLIITVYRL
jgi:Domain of unknown function (DUF4258)